MRKKSETNEMPELKEKIVALLKEYNATIDYDEELKVCILYDIDTLHFTSLSETGKITWTD